MNDIIEEMGIGKRKVNFKLRDWVFSRQRYWGEPIPMVYCEHCGWVPIPENELPLRLPDVENYQPTDNGESPLANMPDWYRTKCPQCGADAKRETDTMPQWAGSSWYFLRYTDPHNGKALAGKDALDYWMNVDWYNGGMEHTTLHLLYSRFWHKFLYDIGVVNTPEPYAKRTSHGMILGENNEKMSKSRGNIVNPDDVVDQYGADTLRLYEMFIGDFEKAAPWNENGVKGCKRFLDRVFKMTELVNEEKGYTPQLEIYVHQTIKKVSDDIEQMKFNTAIAALMKLTNYFYEAGSITKKDMKVFITLLNPKAPHITEEIWEMMDFGGMLCQTSWPVYDVNKTIEDTIEIPIQINGKLRGKIVVSKDANSDELKAAVEANEAVRKFTENMKIVKEIYVPGRVYNIVAK
jgi:leucyl-tRNA synthetase